MQGSVQEGDSHTGRSYIYIYTHTQFPVELTVTQGIRAASKPSLSALPIHSGAFRLMHSLFFLRILAEPLALAKTCIEGRFLAVLGAQVGGRVQGFWLQLCALPRAFRHHSHGPLANFLNKVSKPENLPLRVYCVCYVSHHMCEVGLPC